MSQPADEDVAEDRRPAVTSAVLVTLAAVCWAARFWVRSDIASLLGLGLFVAFVLQLGIFVSRKESEFDTRPYLTFGFVFALSSFAPTVFCGVIQRSDAVPGANVVTLVASVFPLGTFGGAIVQLGLALVGWFVSSLAVRGVWL